MTATFGVLPPGPALRLRRRSLLQALAVGLVVSGVGAALTVSIAAASSDAWLVTVQAGALAGLLTYLVRTFAATSRAAEAMQAAVRNSGCRRSVLRRAVVRDRPLTLGRVAAVEADAWAEACWTQTTLALPASAVFAVVATVYLPVVLAESGPWSGVLAVMVVVGVVASVGAMLRERRAVGAYLRGHGVDLAAPSITDEDPGARP